MLQKLIGESVSLLKVCDNIVDARDLLEQIPFEKSTKQGNLHKVLLQSNHSLRCKMWHNKLPVKTKSFFLYDFIIWFHTLGCYFCFLSLILSLSSDFYSMSNFLPSAYYSFSLLSLVISLFLGGGKVMCSLWCYSAGLMQWFRFITSENVLPIRLPQLQSSSLYFTVLCFCSSSGCCRLNVVLCCRLYFYQKENLSFLSVLEVLYTF